MEGSFQWLTSVELEQEASGSLPLVYAFRLADLRLRVTREWVFLRSACCGEPLEAWDEEPWACGACDGPAKLARGFGDRARVEDFSPGVLEAWTSLELAPLPLTLALAEAFGEWHEAWTALFLERDGAK